ncbi:MAG: bifunctional hydroxymethylpyrimidine kinase/phosphomethylpyrimidine kinase [Chloroflexota bacterium]|nr:bifunctional hydroxymethylpyrimidine kinase/phosphomethylpyrimidine kinase [Dehalococcoidia bacterium]MDW8252935.1 bifunctional hydroxymethylpyrimidine kinase/phosphomethylpyrimidine kinase [Chloroflexota bacterium]
MTVPRALTIAGSDSGGGAGLQADLKTFSALGVYGASVVTAVTAQNTLGVSGVLELPLDLIAAQIDAVATDIGFDATKTGMLSSAAIVELVASKVVEHGLRPLVVDPVMVATSGDRLLREDAVAALRERLIPLATVVTPNLPEAEVLVGYPLETEEARREAAKAIAALGARAVLIKGGHGTGPAVDLYYDGEFVELSAERIATRNTHGTGCTLASAIAAGLARGRSPLEAVREAKTYVTEALRAAFPLGHGHGPVHHFYRWWPSEGTPR